MLDYDMLLRKGYFDVWNGNILLNNAPVPVVDEKLDTRLNESDEYIKLSTQNTQQQNNKRRFAAQVELRAEIVQRTKSVGGKMAVDDIATQMLQLAFPQRIGTAVQMAAPFHLTFARLESSDTSSLLQIEVGFVIIKTLIFLNRVTQD